jgi:hypothetical protein
MVIYVENLNGMFTCRAHALHSIESFDQREACEGALRSLREPHLEGTNPEICGSRRGRREERRDRRAPATAH